jgi:hypothetical protein
MNVSVSSEARSEMATSSEVAVVAGSLGNGALLPGLSVENSLAVVPGTNKCARTLVFPSSTYRPSVKNSRAALLAE